MERQEGANHLEKEDREILNACAARGQLSIIRSKEASYYIDEVLNHIERNEHKNQRFIADSNVDIKLSMTLILIAA